MLTRSAAQDEHAETTTLLPQVKFVCYKHAHAGVSMAPKHSADDKPY
jgi:hypothetical protein